MSTNNTFSSEKTHREKIIHRLAQISTDEKKFLTERTELTEIFLK